MFGFGVGMFSVEMPEGTPKYLTYLYYGFATTCLGAEMYVVASCARGCLGLRRRQDHGAQSASKER